MKIPLSSECLALWFMDEISASRDAISPLTISEMLSEEDAIASLVQIAGSQAGREEDGLFANDIIHDKSGVLSSSL